MSEQPPNGGGQLPPNAVVGGRYELLSLLGRGGMAEVFRARDQRLGRVVAVKRLRVDLAGDPTFQARFRREAQSAASLNHPTIVAVYDTGEELDPNGSGMTLPYIVMELVEGRTLRDILREGRKILPERALEIVASVLAALDYSHRAGIIHRDIKPANVMLTPTGDVKVMDFGIARAIADSSATMTQTAAVVGTAQYLSPEQARGEQVDARSDLYSTGCLLFELLAGRPPFVGDSPVSVAYQHVREEPAAPSTYDSQIPPVMDAIALKSLAKRVDERYQSASEMRADIERALEGQPVQAPAAGAATMQTEHFLPPAAAESTTAMAAAATADDEPPRKRRTGWWVALALLVIAIIIAAAIAVPRLLSDDTAADQVEVPRLHNLTLKQATRKLERAGLEIGDKRPQNSTEVKKNHVIRQAPGPRTYVDQGSAVDIVYSVGVQTAVVPDVTNGSLAQATKTLEAKGFQVHPVKQKRSEERAQQVTRTDPNPGTTKPVGSTVM
ncbi:MAG: Stk1 family PASTA domain-containing Ser/Thr kinase, partial [Nocardioidaceae bacterium]